MLVQEKYKILQEYIYKKKQLVIGFSGGVDSTFLVAVAQKVLGDKALAVTVASPFCPEEEIAQAKAFAQQQKLNFTVLKVNPLADKQIANNPPDRCYYCKKLIFSHILTFAKNMGIEYVADGTNADDGDDYRPGLKALGELKVISPLAMAGFTKEDIRTVSKEMGLATWQKESAACLASRIPYGEIITEKKLKRVELAEKYLKQFAFSHLRVRSHGDLARLEVGQQDINFFQDPKHRAEVTLELKSLGFSYVTVDLQGYRTGSLNEVLLKN